MGPMSVEGAWEIVPTPHGDSRGTFLEWYRPDTVAAVTGMDFRPLLGGMSVSARGVTRGIHFADVPPGQAKYVTCVRGAVYDVVVDIRPGSPTYGQWQALRLDDTEHRAVLIGEGLGHGFCALTDDACVVYLCSQPYDPRRERVVHALDPELGITWPASDPVLSPRDAAAPTLRAAREQGLLPGYDAVRRDG
ncbi:dTDP-4-dehydrorhamnose 3,5-epimerase family protein [Streptomyces sp. NPDC058576]|uniref:dTDP-4-dehydrorhamnose 3,5-epimerase family protein n=1 Tax=Streptomyces sp. NPDC058576 TaxID=3346547 RepID=UPI0036507652